MICPRCGTQLITGSRVCMACGQNVSYISNPSQAPASSAGTFPTAPTAPKLFFHTPGKAREAAAQTPSPASIPFVAPTQTKATPVTPEASAPVKPVTPVTPVTPVKPVAPVTPAGSVITEFPKAKVEEVNNSKEPEKFVNTIPVAEPEVVNTAPAAEPEVVNTAPVAEPEVVNTTPAAEPEVVNTAPAAEPEVVEEPEIVETARTTDEIESIAKAKTGYSDKFIKKYANYWGQLATKLFDNEAYEFVFGGVLNLDGDDDRVAGCGITQKRIIVTTTQGTVSYPYDKTKSVSGSKGLVGAAVNIEIPRSKVKISVDKPYLDNIIKAIDAAIKKYHVA
ncbi:PH domain-containing protein [Eshraghiella crossota]|uniref:PH domain-containing protein n=1 Tax=Eshraghiella crossota TaxID=45851 RepID=UPI003F817E4C